jgi:hypothetical protein
MWTAFTGWFGANPVVQRITAIVVGLFLFIVGWKTIEYNLKEAGKNAERKANAIRAAKEQARVAETRRVIEQETQDARHRADEAVSNLPEYSSADELRARDPDLAAIVFGTGRGSGGQTESR